MTELTLYEEAMCCSTGVCGPDPDDELVEGSVIVSVRFVRFVAVRLTVSVWVPRNSNTRVLGFDEDSSRSRLDCTAKLGSEAFVPTAPQRRLVRYTF